MDRLKHVYDQVDLETFDDTVTKVKELQECVKSYSKQVENVNNNLPMLRASIQKLTREESEQRRNIEERHSHILQLKKELEEMQLEFEELSTKTKDIMTENEKTKEKVCAMINLYKSMFGIEFEVEIQNNKTLKIFMTAPKTVKVVLIFDIMEKCFELKSFNPPQPNFSALQKDLNETNDIRGFLCSLNEILRQIDTTCAQ